MNRTRASWLALAALLVVAAVMLRHFIAAREPWLDEFHTVLLARMSWAELFAFVRGDIHPPGYFSLAKIWLSVTHSVETAPRYLSVAAHLAAAVAFFRVARARYTDHFSGLLGAGLLLMSPALFYYAGEARSYALAVLWSTVVLAVVTVPLPRASTPGQDAETPGGASAGSGLHPVLLGALLACGFYVHYLTVFVAAGTVIGLFLLRPAFRQAALTSATFLAVCLPWVPTTLRQMRLKRALDLAKESAASDPGTLNFVPGSVDQDGASMLETLRGLAENLASIAGVLPVGSPPVMLLLALPLVALGLAALRGALSAEHRAPVVLAATTTLATVAGVVAMGASDRRYLLAITPFLILALMEGFAWLRRRGRPAVATTIALAVFATYAVGAVRVTTAPYGKPLAAVVDYLSDHGTARDLVVFSALYAEFPFEIMAAGTTAAEMGRRGFPMSVREWWSSQAIKWGGPVIRQEELGPFVAGMLGDAGRRQVWLFQFEPEHYDPSERLLATLRGQGALITRVQDPRFFTSQYQLYRVDVGQPRDEARAPGGSG